MDKIAHINLVINFFSREDILVEKLMGRRVCPTCGKNYNVASINTEDGYEMSPLLPKNDKDYCDKCPSSKLVIREDDMEYVIRHRLETYKKETQPLLDFYHKKENTTVIDFEAKKGVDDYPEVKKIVESVLEL